MKNLKVIGIFIVICVILYCLCKKNTIENMAHINNKNIVEQKFNNYEKKACAKLKKEANEFKKKMTKQIIYTKILKKTKEVLDELRIPFFISSGTCLGYLREGKFLDHDYDIDVGIFREDYTPIIINKMAEKGLILYRTLGNVKDGLELSFRLKGTRLGKHAKIDIFLHYKENDNIYWISYIAPKFKKVIKYQVSDFILKPVNFMDTTINVPYPTVKYIREHYGSDWYISTKPNILGGSYDYRTSPTSIVK